MAINTNVNLAALVQALGQPQGAGAPAASTQVMLSVEQLVGVFSALARAWGGVGGDDGEFLEMQRLMEERQREQVEMWTQLVGVRQDQMSQSLGLVNAMMGQNDLQMQVLGGMLPDLKGLAGGGGLPAAAPLGGLEFLGVPASGNGAFGLAFTGFRSQFSNSAPAWAGLL